MPHLPPAHHKTSQHDSLNKTKVAAKSMTHHNQTKEWTTWFLNLPLDKSIDNKSTKLEVQIQDPMKHSYKTQKTKKSLRKSYRKRKTTKANTRQEKR
jgi:dienelactone hydrolase